MKLRIFSDIHLAFTRFSPQAISTDAVVLAVHLMKVSTKSGEVQISARVWLLSSGHARVSRMFGSSTLALEKRCSRATSIKHGS